MSHAIADEHTRNPVVCPGCQGITTLRYQRDAGPLQPPAPWLCPDCTRKHCTPQEWAGLVRRRRNEAKESSDAS